MPVLPKFFRYLLSSISDSNGKQVHREPTNCTLDLECFSFTSIRAFKTVTHIIFSADK